MKLKHFLGLSSALCLGLVLVTMAQAQETGEVEQLRKQLQQANEAFQKAVEQHRQVIEALNKRLETIQPTAGGVASKPAAAQETNALASAPALETKRWSATDPIRVAGGGQSYLNLSLDGLFAAGYSTAEDVESLQTGGHDPKQRGFTVQNVELTLAGAVDPYFRGQGNVVLVLTPEGETEIELEEAFLESSSLPWGLQLKTGQYFTEFGRLNPTHPHAWDFVDQPLVNGRFFGGDGLRNPGARVSWLVPTPFYSELFFGAQNSQGETAESFRSDHEGEFYLGRPAGETRVKGFGDMLYSSRYAASFNLAEEHTLVAGASGAFGPNTSGSDTDTQIYGVDLFYKWKPRNHTKGFPFVTWQTEWMYRRYEAGAFAGDTDHPAQSRRALRDWGLYSQVAWGFRPRWVATLRGDYVNGDDADLGPESARRWRVSPALTFYPSEFSKLRLQYNRDDRERVGVDHSVWLQVEFLLGAHAAHKF